MAIIDFSEDKKFYVDDRLKRDLDKIKKSLETKDRDYVVVVDGYEGDGKSCFSNQLCAFMDSTFTEDRMCMTGKEFIDKVDKSKRQSVCFDEAYEDLSSRGALSIVNRFI